MNYQTQSTKDADSNQKLTRSTLNEKKSTQYFNEAAENIPTPVRKCIYKQYMEEESEDRRTN